MILIDSGSTHNFINPSTTEKAGIEVQRNGTLEVMVANEDRLSSTGYYKKVTLSIKGVSVVTEFYLLKL